jgi:hypothetical protein
MNLGEIANWTTRLAEGGAQKGKAATIPIVTVVPVRFIAGIVY